MTDPTQPDRLNVAELTGTWLNSDPDPRLIETLSTAVRSDLALIRVFGVNQDSPSDWGEASPGALFTDAPQSATVAGCLVDYDFGSAQLHLQVQLKLGVAVVGSFCTFNTPAGANRGFVREFLGRLRPGADDFLPESEAQIAPPDPSALAAAIDRPAGDAQELVAGRWLNAAPSGGRFAALEIETDAGTPGNSSTSLRIWERAGGTTQDWGTLEAELYGCVEEDQIPSVCLLASYDRPDSRVEFQIRQNKGILAVTFFTKYHAQGEAFDYVTRELFYQ